MPQLILTKHHGLGNDFLVLLDTDDRHRERGAGLARTLCDRRRGIGADGFIRVGPGTDGADVSMELRNADGGRAEMSGNGIRCLAQAVVDAGLHGGPDLVVATDGGRRHLVVHPEYERGLRQVAVDMGEVTVTLVAEGVAEASLGNPHLVLLDQDHRLDVLEQGRAHPDRNVELIAVTPNGAEIDLRVHERGVGLTQACGTGSCAAAAVARRWGLVGDAVTVHNPGGDVHVELGPGDVPAATLIGPAQFIGRIEVLA